MSVNTMIERLRDLISNILTTGTYVVDSSNQLKLSSEETSKASEQISLTIQEVAIGSERQSSNLLESSGIIDDISLSVEHITMNAKKASQSSEDATKVAMSGEVNIRSLSHTMTSIGDNVNGLVAVVKGLGDKSAEIEQIVAVINQIANQTNLLALNAAIEAARAGEHGRGFAVVAEEVKKLAEQSAASTQEITRLISSIQQETQKTEQSTENVMGVVMEGRKAVEVAGVSFEQIRHSFEEVAGQIKL